MPPNALAAAEPRWRAWACLGLLLAGLYLVAGPKLALSQWRVDRAGNAGLDEALQWQRGELALSAFGPRYEAPEVDGRRYNAVGPGFTVIAFLGTTLSRLAGEPPDTFYPLYFVALVALPLPLVGFWAFCRVVGDAAWAAVLTAYLLIATCLLPVLVLCGQGSLYHLNHALAVTGLLLMGGDLLGSRRGWPAVLGLALAAWSRQMTVLYLPAALWLLLRSSRQAAASSGPDAAAAPNPSVPPPRRHRWSILLGAVFIVAVPLLLNTLKFGSPLDSGYTRMYAGRTDHIARRAERCFFGPANLPEHLWAMNLSFPRLDVRQGRPYLDSSGLAGASLWLTSPLLLGIFPACRRWWRDPPRRALMLSSIVVLLGVGCYHTTGSYDSGYYRYALDVIPVWLLALAPETASGRARWMTLMCLAYGGLYHHFVH